MSKLQFDYTMQIEYSVEVSTCNFTIKCIPQTNARQQIENLKIELIPPLTYNRGVDGFQNAQIYGANHIPHTTFFFHISGEATTGMADYEEVENNNLTMVFKHPYGLNKPGEKIRSYYKQLEEELGIAPQNGKADESNLQVAKRIMHCLYRDFTYQAGVTDVKTSAEEALKNGCGVCQDYAHIFISLLLLRGIPARYVTGLILGEGASHAWVEVWENGKWYGLDPTNDKVVCEEHIKIAVGRDAHDCMINRGIMHGGGLQTQEIKVHVRKIGAQLT